MAGGAYRLLIEGELSTDKIQAKIKSLEKSMTLQYRIEADDFSFKKLKSKLDQLNKEGNALGKIKIFEDDNGKINKAVIEYKNQLGQVEKITTSIDKNVKTTRERYIDYNKVLSQIAKTEKDVAISKAKQNDEMAKAVLNAEKFLAKSKNMNQTDSVRATVTKAQEIKSAVTEGDIAKVRKLNDEFAILKSSLHTGRTGLDSWTEGMKNALKQTVEYALSIGLVYGALNQLSQGIEYISQLNKEMTNIQLLQVDGAKTNEQIGNLAMRYNSLAKEVGATTLEVAKGSVEWLFNKRSFKILLTAGNSLS